jgi:tetratricopeptide (TPR) repeat protein
MAPSSIDIHWLLKPIWFLAVALMIVAPCVAESEQPNADAALLKKAFSAHKDSDEKSALKFFSAYLGRHPDDVVALRGRIAVYLREGQYRKAVVDLSHLINLVPGDRDSYAKRAGAYEQLHAHKKAIADYTKEIELAPERYLGYLNRATAESKVGLTQAAIDDCTKSISIKPTHAALYLRADMYNELGLKDKEEQDRKACWSAPNAFQPEDY